MKSSLEHLPSSKQLELQQVTQMIVETIHPEKVILYGSYATGTWQEERYTTDHVLYEFVSDYDLLVITKTGEKLQDYQINDKLVNRSRYRVPINLITHDIDYVNQQLSNGQYFFTDIIKDGILLYDARISTFVSPKILSSDERRTIAKKDFDKWFESARIFLESSKLTFQTLKSLKESAFILHQSAERTFNTIILVFNGYKPKTHNLDKLLKLSLINIPKVIAFFPRNNPLEKRLFDLLQKAYIDARYSDNYIISEQEILELQNRITSLQTLTKEECLAKINML